MKGRVKMFNAERGFGFITGEDGKDTYFHQTSVEGGATIAVGDSVATGSYDSINIYCCNMPTYV